ncbi:rhodanese-like domain-containing protein [Anaerobacillus sp. MEB173]|uniref:rhodanese-like domain-containing protein n=1 Tax=Anaerobacillus sp. MEB173 TaxID=3383345 RepID=UPI003F931FB4
MVKKLIFYTISLTLLTVLFGCNQSSTNEITHINVDQLTEMLQEQNEDVFFVDVREPHEYNEGHIKEMTNVPLSQLENSYQQIPTDKKVVIICRSGNRSVQAAHFLMKQGYRDLVNVEGGMLEWSGEIIN